MENNKNGALFANKLAYGILTFIKRQSFHVKCLSAAGFIKGLG